MVCEDVPQVVEQPSGPHIEAWFQRRRLLTELSDPQLLTRSLWVGPDVNLVSTARPGPLGWHSERVQLHQARGLRWEIDCDDAIAALVAGCRGELPLQALIAVVASSVGAPVEPVTAAVLPVVRDLIGRGLLLLDDPLLPAGGGR